MNPGRWPIPTEPAAPSSGWTPRCRQSGSDRKLKGQRAQPAKGLSMQLVILSLVVLLIYLFIRLLSSDSERKD
jgi:hypothetical protein